VFCGRHGDSDRAPKKHLDGVHDAQRRDVWSQVVTIPLLFFTFLRSFRRLQVYHRDVSYEVVDSSPLKLSYGT
jgi:hypothetical protein